MAIKGTGLTINFFALTSATGGGKTGEASNITLGIVKDGAAAIDVAGSITEVSATGMPGLYEVPLSTTEMNANFIAVHGSCSTAGVFVVPTFIQTDQGNIAIISADTNEIQGKLPDGNIADALTSAAVITQGDSAWATATGFATTPELASTSAAIIAQGDSAWATATGFVTTPELASTSAAIIAQGNSSWSTALVNAVTAVSVTDVNIAQEATVKEVSGGIITQGDSAWATATGFVTTPELASTSAAIIAQGDSAWATATGFVTTPELASTSAAIITQGDSAWATALVNAVTATSVTDKTGYSLADDQSTVTIGTVLSASITGFTDTVSANIVQVQGVTVTDIDDFKADITTLATTAQLASTSASLVTEINENEAKLDINQITVNAISADTDAILIDTGTTIPGTITTLQATSDAISADTNEIQTKLPSGDFFDFSTDVVSATVVSLGNSVSANVTAVQGVTVVDIDDFKADITTLATTAQLASTSASLVTEIDANETKIDNVQITVNSISGDTSVIGPASVIDSSDGTITGALKKIADDSGGTTFDATTDSLEALQGTVVEGLPSNNLATSGGVANATVDAGSFSATWAQDGTYWQTSPNGSPIDISATFELGVAQPTSLLVHGRMAAGGGTRYADVWAYDWDTSAWEQISNSVSRMNESNSDSDHEYVLFSKHVSNDGDAYIRWISNDGTANRNLYLDFVSIKSVLAGSTPSEIADAVYIKMADTVYRGSIWIDTVNGVAGTDVGIHGIPSNPVSALDDALSLATSVGVRSYHMIPGSSLTLDQAYTQWNFEGREYNVDLNGQDISDTSMDHAIINGTATASTGDPHFENCELEAVLIPAGHMINCGLTGPISANTSADDYFLVNCYSNIAGNNTPDIYFTTSANANFRHYSGGIRLFDMADGSNMSLEGFGQLRIDSSCTGGAIAIRGHFNIIDLAGGAVSITELARYDVGQVSAFSLSAITEYDPATTTELASSATQIVTEIDTNETKIDNLQITANTISADTSNIDTLVTANLDTPVSDVSGAVDSLLTTNHGAGSWESLSGVNTQAEMSAASLLALNDYDPATTPELASTSASLVTEINGSETKIDNLQITSNAISADTTNIDSNVDVVLSTRASETNATTNTNTIVSEIDDNETILNAISADTDSIKSTVDTNLDATVSSRSTLTTSDLANTSAAIVEVGDANWATSASKNSQAELSAGSLLALNDYDPSTTNELASTSASLVTEINGSETKIDNLQITSNAISADTVNLDATISSRASTAELASTSAAIIAQGDANWATSASVNTQAQLSAGALLAFNDYDPATTSELASTSASLVTEINENETKIDNLQITSDAISADTDGISSAVISYLDASVSSRASSSELEATSAAIASHGDANWATSATKNTQAELSAGSLLAITDYNPATTPELASTSASLVTEINSNETKIDNVQVTVNSISADTNQIQSKLPTGNFFDNTVDTVLISGTKNQLDDLNDISVADILAGTVDTQTIEVVLEYMLAMATGKIVKTSDTFTYYKQDNSTSAFSLSGSTDARVRL